MSLIKQKQVEDLQSVLASKADDNVVLKKANNLSDVVDRQEARNNLDLLTSTEINNLISGTNNAISVDDLAARAALSDLKVADRVFVTDDGDGKWAIYMVTAVTNGSGSTSTFEKIADKDLFDNAMTAAAVKTAYESNANTNALTDAEKAKLAHISVTQAVDLDDMESDISANASAIATKMDQFTYVEESFTGMNVAPGAVNVLNLSHPIASSHAVTVFFEGVKVTDVTYAAGTVKVNINVRYATDPSDTIYVQYAY